MQAPTVVNSENCLMEFVKFISKASLLEKSDINIKSISDRNGKRIYF